MSELNPQPLPPSSQAELNPQPLPPGIQLDAFAEAVTAGVLRALEARKDGLQPLSRRPGIIVGVIIDPTITAE